MGDIAQWEGPALRFEMAPAPDIERNTGIDESNLFTDR